MVDLVNRAQILKLISELEDVTEKLTSNELEMYSHIKDKYTSSDEGTFDDKVCLEVLLRNISIREGYGMDKDSATRVIDFENKT